MSKETEKRLIRTLEFLKEPQGSTIPTIVKAINDNDPKISLKRIVQTLKGCLDSGVVKVADGRVKLKQMGGLSDGKSEKNDGFPEYRGRPKNPCQRGMSKGPRTCQGEDGPPPDAPPENPDNPENPDGEDPNCKPKPKPKPKCPKPKKKPKCPKPKKKPKCKPKPKKKCPPKKKIQPYCKKKKKCEE